MTSTAPLTHDTVATRFVDAGGTRFAYRRFGTPGHHVRGFLAAGITGSG